MKEESSPLKDLRREIHNQSMSQKGPGYVAFGILAAITALSLFGTARSLSQQGLERERTTAAACIQQNEQSVRSINGYMEAQRELVARADPRDPNATPEKIADFLSAQQARANASYPARDCTKEGIQEYLDSPASVEVLECDSDGRGYCKPGAKLVPAPVETPEINSLGVSSTPTPRSEGVVPKG